jgi:hypothetical protein
MSGDSNRAVMLGDVLGAVATCNPGWGSPSSESLREEILAAVRALPTAQPDNPERMRQQLAGRLGLAADTEWQTLLGAVKGARHAQMPAPLDLADAIQRLEWCDRRGGLGHDVHERLQTVIEMLRAAKAHLDLPRESRTAEPVLVADMASALRSSEAERARAEADRKARELQAIGYSSQAEMFARELNKARVALKAADSRVMAFQSEIETVRNHAVSGKSGTVPADGSLLHLVDSLLVERYAAVSRADRANDAHATAEAAYSDAVRRAGEREAERDAALKSATEWEERAREAEATVSTCNRIADEYRPDWDLPADRWNLSGVLTYLGSRAADMKVAQIQLDTAEHNHRAALEGERRIAQAIREACEGLNIDGDQPQIARVGILRQRLDAAQALASEAVARTSVSQSTIADLEADVGSLQQERDDLARQLESWAEQAEREADPVVLSAAFMGELAIEWSRKMWGHSNYTSKERDAVEAVARRVLERARTSIEAALAGVQRASSLARSALGEVGAADGVASPISEQDLADWDSGVITPFQVRTECGHMIEVVASEHASDMGRALAWCVRRLRALEGGRR